MAHEITSRPKGRWTEVSCTCGHSIVDRPKEAALRRGRKHARAAGQLDRKLERAAMREAREWEARWFFYYPGFTELCEAGR